MAKKKNTEDGIGNTEEIATETEIVKENIKAAEAEALKEAELDSGVTSDQDSRDSQEISLEYDER